MHLSRSIAVPGLLVAALALTGCASGAATGGSSDGSSGLAVGITSSIQSLKPYPIGDPQLAVKRSLFDTLITLNEGLEPEPRIAESWEIDDASTSLTLTLRDGVLFSDGTAVDAEAVVWNLEYAQDPEAGLQGAGVLGGAEFSAVDESTVEIALASSTPQIFSLLNNIVIISPESFEVIDSAPIGSGPYVIDTFDPGSALSLVPNESYWDDAPLASEIDFRTYPDSSALVAAVQSGGVDVAYQVPFSDVSRLSEGTTKTLIVPGAGNFNIMVQSAEGPTADPRVRQALGYALDRERFADTFLNGVTASSCIMWPASSPAYDAAMETCEFDLDKAAALLAEAGYADGFDIEFVINRATVSELADFAQVYQADLATIGVNLTISEVEETEIIRTAIAADFTGMVGHRYGFANQDPAFAFGALPFRGTENPTRFDSDEWRGFISDGQLSTTREERMDAYRAAAAFLAQQAFNLPMANQPRALAMAADLEGLTLGNGDLALNLTSASK
tara:strand:+ start:146265 stop:147776 length:1512 start_codon:yes stop_codon:yes gene_type:complete